MEYEKIKQLMDDMGNSKLSELEIEFPEGIKISMKKNDSKSHVINKVNDFEAKTITETPQIISQIPESSPAVPVQEAKKQVTGNIVKAPMVGTFYLKPSPDSKPYVEVGTEVKKGDTLCIIEAMKLMNEIESDYSGVIKEVLVNDGEPIEYGTELFIIE